MTQTLLAIGAHCDDCIIGIPGILLKAVRRGYRVVILALIGDFENWPAAARMKGRGDELRDGTAALCREFGAELRYLDFRSQHLVVSPEAAKAVARVVADLEPDVAFLPWRDDYNEDHVVAARLGEVAIRYGGPLLDRGSAVRRHRPVYAYDTGPSHTIGFEPDTWVDVTEEWSTAMEWLARMLALITDTSYGPAFEHEAQHVKATLGAYRGLACGVAYAEALRSRDAFVREIL